MTATSTARFRVVSAGPLVTFQDVGRSGGMRFGVPASGPMDRFAHAAANVALGNDPGATAVEVSLGGLTLEVASGAATVAVVGGGFVVECGRRVGTSWQVLTMRAGDQITIRPGAWGSWTYVAVAGSIDVPRWLGSSATHSMSGFGGGSVRAGSEFVATESRIDEARDGELSMPDHARAKNDIRIVMGPQDHQFEPATIATVTSSTYRVSSASDRMGARLDGPVLTLRSALSIPSEPIVRGSIQVAGDGVPTVLLADHQTTGGYPKIATVISSDIDRFAQLRPGDAVAFSAVSPVVAVEQRRLDERVARQALAAIASDGRELAHRLRSHNLIGGAISPASDDRP